jgi:DNA polymerase-3 subunit alpha (Gram-positive type)
LKFDILGHVDPTAMRLLQRIATVKPLDIPMNDPETLSLFHEDTALHADPKIYKKTTGASACRNSAPARPEASWKRLKPT